MAKFIALTLLLVTLYAIGGDGQSTTKKPSPCPYGSIWYNPAGERCHCQSHNQQAYYVCDSNGSTTTSTTQRPGGTTAKPSPCPHGPIWTNPKGQRCHCQSYNQTPYYVCE